MSDLYPGNPEEERKKAQAFFEKGKSVAGAAQFDFAISIYLQGLDKDPDNVEAQQQLRDISLKRKVSGEKGLGFMEALSLKKPGKDDKLTFLNAVKILAHDPGSMSAMLNLTLASQKAGFYDTAMWIAKITMEANITNPKGGPDYKTFIALKDVYKALSAWPEAVDACNWATKLRPDDMDLVKEAKDLGAQLTMMQGNYNKPGGSFRDSIRDADKQRDLMEQDSDVRTVDAMKRQLATAEAEWKAEPNEAGKLMNYVEKLRKTESMEHENLAIEILEEAFKRTGQFRFRKAAGEIKLSQLNRMERSLRTALQKSPGDEDLKKQYQQFNRERVEEELAEFTLWVENYPTESQFRFQMAQRLFLLGRYDEAIPVFQNARNDPKYKVDATTLLGRAFMEAGFVDEAVDTMRDAIEAYQVKGDPKSIEMTYYYGRALEAKGDVAMALKQYSQVAQWEFQYRDVQARIKKLRPPPKG